MKKIVTTATALALALLVAAPLNAAAPKPQIEDPYGDANGINDQGTGDGSQGDVTGPGDAGNASDLGSVTFTNDAKNLYITLLNEQSPPATQGLGLRVRVNGEPGSQCLLFEAYYTGATNNLTATEAILRDTCAGGDPIPVEILGTQFIVPRKAHEALGKGKVLTNPQAQSFVWSGTSYPAGVAGPYIDTTKVGADYKLKK
ncbi:MAG TPA: hypothetical protein VHN37_08480 [Actinomycetota bacterium]|nr:hypothetical protein [Actinomycetota bacterium]